MKQIQIFAPVDFGLSWRELNYWKSLKNTLELLGWQQTHFSTNLEFDLSFFQYYRWLEKTIPVNNIENKAPESVNIDSCKVLLCNTGIALLIVNYRLIGDRSTTEIQQLYENLSKNHFYKLFKEICKSLKKTELGRISETSNDLFKRETIYLEKETPHWTHGILVHRTAKQSELLSKQDLFNFSLAETYHEYHIQENSTRCSIGWEMTSISTTRDVKDDALIRLVWFVGFLWEEMYVFENLTVAKVNNLESKVKNVQMKLAGVRKLRSIVTTVIASVSPSSITMIDRYVKILEIIMQQWKIADRKESLTGKIGLLELMYSNKKDEVSERNASTVNLYALLITIVNSIASIAVIIDYVSGARQFTSSSMVIWITSVVVLLSFILTFRYIYNRKI